MPSQIWNRPLALVGCTFVELSQRPGVARWILQPVDMSGVLKRHLRRVWVPGPDDLAPGSQDVPFSVEHEHRALVCRDASQDARVFLRNGSVGLDHRSWRTARDPLRIRIRGRPRIHEVVVPGLGHHVTHRPGADRTRDDETGSVGVEPGSTHQARTATLDLAGLSLRSLPFMAYAERRTGQSQTSDPVREGPAVCLGEQATP